MQMSNLPQTASLPVLNNFGGRLQNPNSKGKILPVKHLWCADGGAVNEPFVMIVWDMNHKRGHVRGLIDHTWRCCMDDVLQDSKALPREQRAHAHPSQALSQRHVMSSHAHATPCPPLQAAAHMSLRTSVRGGISWIDLNSLNRATD